MQDFNSAIDLLRSERNKWLVTGVAGFIGSNILEFLLSNHQDVVGIDNFETGSKVNLEFVKKSVSNSAWKNFKFYELDILDKKNLINIFNNIDFTLHQAALGSVPRSIVNPTRTNEVNISGFLNILEASTKAEVKAFIYAASSSTYGDHKSLPKVEDHIGNPLSPYAVTKYANELYAKVFSDIYQIHTIGLRYFNVYGLNQDPNGPYAAVIPRWISSMLKKEKIFINGDGTTSRDFCYVKDAVQANILAALNHKNCNPSDIFNISYGEQNSLKKLFELIKEELNNNGINYLHDPIYRDFRKGDVKHSLADISKAKSLIAYSPLYSLKEGLVELISQSININE